jgi:hypothetical protein
MDIITKIAGTLSTLWYTLKNVKAYQLHCLYSVRYRRWYTLHTFNDRFNPLIYYVYIVGNFGIQSVKSVPDRIKY